MVYRRPFIERESPFLPSFVFVLGGARYIELVRDNRLLQAFLAGVSAAVVGVIIVVSIDLIPTALVGWVSIAIATMAFLVIVLFKIEVAFVALGAMAAGIVYMVGASEKLRKSNEVDYA